MQTEPNQERATQLSPEPAIVAIGRYLSLGWQIFTEDLFGWILLCLIYFAVLGVVSTTGIGVLVVLGPLEAGWYAVILKRLRQGTLDIGEFAKGFHHFVSAFLIGAVVSVFASVGFVFLIAPGIVILALYLFVFPILLDTGQDFWGVMEASRKAVAPRWFEWSLFVLAQLVLIVLGSLLCGVGLLVALPWTKIATAVAYEEHFRER